ncbi:MAG: hypothetical protein ACXWH1_05470 [Thermoanaerobaculia bacterium]
MQLLVRAGVRTRIEKITARGELVTGTVLGGDERNRVTVTSGDVRLVAWSVRRPDEQFMQDGSVDSDGRFRLLVPSEVLWLASREAVMVAVFYHGTQRFAPCRSAEVQFERTAP